MLPGPTIAAVGLPRSCVVRSDTMLVGEVMSAPELGQQDAERVSGQAEYLPDEVVSTEIVSVGGTERCHISSPLFFSCTTHRDIKLRARA